MLGLQVGVLAQDERQNALQGIDVNGRIPKVELPDGLKHPERWRYFPEGRLMEGDVFQRFLVSSFFSPIIFREADVGTGGGLAITDLDFRNQRRREFANIVVTYSTEGQQTYNINWRRWTHHRELPDGGVLQDERSYLSGFAGYNKSLTSRYYGRGPDRPESAESSYTHERTAVEFAKRFTVPDPADNLIVEIGGILEHNKLASGRVSDALDTRVAYPGDFSGGDRDILWLQARAAYDTRDSLHNPYKGWHIGLSGAGAVAQTGGDVGAVFSLTGSKVFTVPPLLHRGGVDEENPPTDTIAIGVATSSATGELPFYALPSLGGSRTLRGYINNRWTDEAAWHAGAEYRLWFIPRGFSVTETVRVERIGTAFFYEVGSVASTWTGLFDDKPKYSYGTSLRISLERTALFRFDIGFSDEDSNFSIAYGLTF